METEHTEKTSLNPKTGLLAWIWGLIALGVFGATMSPVPFPGLPAQSLASHLGITPFPTFSDGLWGMLIRLFSRLPGTEAFWAGALSVLCGAFSVGVACLLVARIQPRLDDAKKKDAFREDFYSTRARWVAGSVTALFLIAAPPFWLLATRSLPGMFQLALLMLVLLFFSEYQRAGGAWRLYLIGLLYGLGITEYASFILFAPVAAVLIARAMLQRGQFATKTLIRTGLCALPPLLLYGVHAARFMASPGAGLLGYSSTLHALWSGILRMQFMQIAHSQPLQGMLLMLALAILPWCVMFLLRPAHAPWRFDFWSLSIRWLILLCLMGTAFDLPYAPWRFTGPNNAMPLPYLLMAAAIGMVAGEFSLMDIGRHTLQRLTYFLRRVSALAVWLAPIALVVAIVLNYPQANGRVSLRLQPVIEEIIEGLQGRDILLTSGILDEPIQLAAREKGVDVQVISLRHVSADRYLKRLGETVFTTPRQQSLLGVNFMALLRDFLSTQEGLLRTAALDRTDELREAGYLVPDRMLFRAEWEAADVNLDALLPGQQDFRTRIEALLLPLSVRNPLAPYEDYVKKVASKVANNFGFAQAERGEEAPAWDSFAAARAIYPGNLSALLNQITLAEKEKRPEFEPLKQEFENVMKLIPDASKTQFIWQLSAMYGYVHNTGWLASTGMIFAMSGKPRMAEAELRRAASTGEDIPAEFKNVLAKAYLQTGELERGVEFYKEMLKENPKDYRAMLGLAHWSIANGRIEEAVDYMRQVTNLGVKPEALRFERALIHYARGEKNKAADLLVQAVEAKPDDIRALALLASILAEKGDDARLAKSIDAIKNHIRRHPNPEANLWLADFYLKRGELPAARQELENLVRMNPTFVRAWELLVNIDFAEQRAELAKEHVDALLTLDPRNFYGNLIMASLQTANEHLALAESSYRTAISIRREPTALNDLAYIIYMQRGDLSEALALANEAVARAPKHPAFLSTRAEILVALDRAEEAEQDIQTILMDWPDHAQILFLAMKIYDAQGKTDAVRQLAENLSKRREELLPQQQEELGNLLARLRQ